MKRLIYSLVASLLFLQGCSNPHSFIVNTLTESQSKSMASGLTEDEKTKLAGWMIRTKLQQAFGAADMTVGVTVGQAIQQQEAWLVKEKADDDDRAVLKKKAEAEQTAKQIAYQAAQDTFNKRLTVAVLSKTNKMRDYEHDVVFSVAYQNNSNKPLRALNGVLIVTSLLGNPIMKIKWETTHTIASGDRWVESDNGVSINQFIPNQVKLWESKYEDLKFTFNVTKILYTDGTVEQAPESPST